MTQEKRVHPKKRGAHLRAPPLPQVEAYMQNVMPDIFAAARLVEARETEERSHVLTWQIFGKRPKVGNNRQFILQVERILAKAFDECGYTTVLIWGFSHNMSFEIRWTVPANKGVSH